MLINKLNENIDSLISYGMIGLISTGMGVLFINLVLKKDQRKEYNKFKTYFMFFLIGIIIHFFVQTVNLDQIYCDKKCQMRLKLNE